MCIPARYVVAILTSLGLALLYGIRISINMAIVSMVIPRVENRTTAGNQTMNATSICGIRADEVKDEQHQGIYDWSDKLQGLILSSYYWGYLVVLLPSARLAELTSVKWVFFGAMGLNIAATILTPLCASIHYSLVFAMRIIQGFGSGATIPCTSLILARWVPVPERNTVGSLVFSGTTLGNVLATFGIGFIDKYLGWRFIFYIMGGICIPWLALWLVFVADTPQKARFIRQEEVDMILLSLGDKATDKKKVVILWKNIFTSKPFWALFVSHGCGNWVGYLLVTNPAIYMRKAFGFTLAESSRYIGIGAATNWFFGISLGKCMDYVRKRTGMSQTRAKKTAVLIGYIPALGCTIGMAHVGCLWQLGITLIIGIYMFLGASFCGWMTNHVDIGPKIAATLMALTNLFGTTSGILVPFFVGVVLRDQSDLMSWCLIFWVSAGSIIILILAFTIFGSGEKQNYYNEVDIEQKPE